MVEQPAAEPTFVRPPSQRDQRQTCPEGLQGSRNPLYKISTEPVAPAEWRKKPRQPLSFCVEAVEKAPKEILG